MKKNLVNPTTLKGQDKMNHIRDLMGKINPTINESVKRSVLEIYKNGPDGNIYGVVRENHEYFIKVADNKENITVDDFNYLGGLKNKKDYVYESYAKATRQLKLKLMSLNEAYGVENNEDTNVLMNEDLATAGGFSSMGSGFADNVFEEENVEENEFVEEDAVEEEEVNEVEEVPTSSPEVNPGDEKTGSIKEVMLRNLQEKFELTEDEANYMVNEILKKKE